MTYFEKYWKFRYLWVSSRWHLLQAGHRQVGQWFYPSYFNFLYPKATSGEGAKKLVANIGPYWCILLSSLLLRYFSPFPSSSYFLRLCLGYFFDCVLILFPSSRSSPSILSPYWLAVYIAVCMPVLLVPASHSFSLLFVLFSPARGLCHCLCSSFVSLYNTFLSL